MSDRSTPTGSTAKYAAALQAERERLETQLAQLADLDNRNRNAGVTGVPVNDDANDSQEGTELYFREQDEAVRSSLQEDLKNNGIAMHKLEEGSYGLCDRCGEKIAAIRLEALPSALYCRECAEVI